MINMDTPSDEMKILLDQANAYRLQINNVIKQMKHLEMLESFDKMILDDDERGRMKMKISKHENKIEPMVI